MIFKNIVLGVVPLLVQVLNVAELWNSKNRSCFIFCSSEEGNETTL